MKRLVTAALAVLVAASCVRAKPAESDGTPVDVSVAEVVPLDIAELVKGYGSLSFQDKADVTAREEGQLVRLLAKEGDEVRRGQLMAVLENKRLEIAEESARNAVDQAQAARQLALARKQEGEFAAEARVLQLERSGMELEQAKAALAEGRRVQDELEILHQAGGLSEEEIIAGRIKVLNLEERAHLLAKDLAIREVGLRDEDLAAAGYSGFTSDQERRMALIGLCTASLCAELMAAQARLSSAITDLKAVRLSLSELELRSPIDGVVGAVYVSPGECVKPDTAVFTVMDVDSLHAVIQVDEVEAAGLEEGCGAELLVDATGGVFKGSIKSIAPVADARSGSVTVKIALRDKPAGLKPGLFVRVTIHTGRGRTALIAPDACLLGERDGEASVFVVAGGRVYERTVRLGESLPEGRELVSGVSRGDVLVSGPGRWLKEGDHVSIAEES